MKNAELYEVWKAEEKAVFQGWDFSRVDKYIEREPLPWDYKDIVLKYLKTDMRLLDMGTGGGEFLRTLNHPYENTFVTECYEPNYNLCLEKLTPLGITVRTHGEGSLLPYEDSSFDIVINRHESYLAEDISRVLKPKGLLITQQVGGEDNNALSGKLTKGFAGVYPDFDLTHEEIKFQQAGFDIFYKNEKHIKMHYSDMRAVVFTAKAIEWEFPEFSVDKCFDKLLDLQKELEEKGFIESAEHRFIICAKKGD